VFAGARRSEHPANRRSAGALHDSALYAVRLARRGLAVGTKLRRATECDRGCNMASGGAGRGQLRLLPNRTFADIQGVRIAR